MSIKSVIIFIWKAMNCIFIPAKRILSLFASKHNGVIITVHVRVFQTIFSFGI